MTTPRGGGGKETLLYINMYADDPNNTHFLTQLVNYLYASTQSY